jgi:hypothetical protein
MPGARASNAAATELDQDPRQTGLFGSVVGVNTSGNRTDIGVSFAANLENLCPVGAGNLVPIPNFSAPLHTFASAPYSFCGQNYNGTEYLVVFCVDGSVWLWNIAAKTATQINVGTLLSGANSQCSYWPISSPPALIFIDSTGYYEWNGTTFSLISETVFTGLATLVSGSDVLTVTGVTTGALAVGNTMTDVGGAIPAFTTIDDFDTGSGGTGTYLLSQNATATISTPEVITGQALGVPSGGDCIEIYNGRVFISQGRALYCSGAGDYSANAWMPLNGAGFSILTDPNIRGPKITRMRSAQGLLYYWHPTGVNVISNLSVPLGLIPPSPTWQDTNIEAVSGCDQPNAVVPFDTYDIWAARSGGWQMYGLTPLALSQDVSDTWKYVDWTQPVSAGQFVLNGINWAAFTFKRLNDPNFGSNWITGAVSYLNGGYRWWFLNAGTTNPIDLIATGWINNTPYLFGFSGSVLYQFCEDTTTTPTIVFQTALTPTDNVIRQKQTLKCGFQADFYNIGNPSNFSLTLDNENTSTAVAIQLPTAVAGNYQRYFPNGDAPNAGKRFVGFTLTATGWNIKIRVLAFDYMLREPWGLP